MNIKHLNTNRVSDCEVLVTYSLDGTEFTVEWNSICEFTGEIGDYCLLLNTKSEDEDLAYRVDTAISYSESDDNPDLDLYLFIRDEYPADRI